MSENIKSYNFLKYFNFYSKIEKFNSEKKTLKLKFKNKK